MKNIDKLIQKALELQANGLVTRQIADELNVSRETVTWLLTRAKKEEVSSAPKDISVNWSSIGKSAFRMRHVGIAMCDMVIDTVEATGSEIDLVVGIGLSGVPLASLMAEELNTELSVYHAYNEQGDDSKLNGAFSRNFAGIKGKKCIIVDDVITTGNTMSDVVTHLRSSGAKPMAIAVLVDKSGSETLSEVPVHSLVRITRVD
ncbi:MAG: orotate phosphoribosyltransferase [Methanolobus sp.]|jgi:orotate phosphoribosyltransferase|uniref:Transcriptional regulator GfcR n=1 Tax=Methanolobus tindarius DSM 2278 TaxID=1090322 RepID=W9DWZ4_METTI|nr:MULTISPECIES: orotate phosphoribosyltransferase-like protein [Methanolobus]ETA67946.1 orotate phosphoribosyltransferase-like enzyme [Methanolobus tindarius DSM 2278]MDI3485806.1 orotate phosphoribosyltransferase [Methanolobus sp.]MDK2831174.1 orotate phosphoribosyltransferase [Methanolobus sp.]MDK2937937.1 orotate phosphoribosyltransferase [Methanolobus sp.]